MPTSDPAATAFRLTVGQVAEQSGVAPSAVRFYEARGLIEAERSATNQRLFTESAACRIQVGRLAQRVGLTVRESADLLGRLPIDPQPEDWRNVAGALIQRAHERVRELETHLDALGSHGKICEIDPDPHR